MITDLKIFNWPGWPLDNNPHGEDFDLAARKRMLAGSKVLLPFLKKHKNHIGNIILEVGPFFNPLITPEEFPKAKIFFWENDNYVLKHFNNIYSQKTVYPIFCNLNKIDENSLLKLELKTIKHFNKLGLKKISFDSIIISQVFNFIDYKSLLIKLKKFIKKDGLIFINNRIDYGLPKLFSEKNPKNINEIIKIIKKTGYEIIEKKIQKNNRLILVAKNKGLGRLF